jgi:hypothetical protein
MRDTSAGGHEPARYEIRMQGHLSTRWAARFDGMSLTTHRDGTTVLRGLVLDQAALHGLLTQLRDTGLPLVSVTHLEIPPQTAPPPTPLNPSHMTPQGD